MHVQIICLSLLKDQPESVPITTSSPAIKSKDDDIPRRRCGTLFLEFVTANNLCLTQENCPNSELVLFFWVFRILNHVPASDLLD